MASEPKNGVNAVFIYGKNPIFFSSSQLITICLYFRVTFEIMKKLNIPMRLAAASRS
jgi:hypothetical protein